MPVTCKLGNFANWLIMYFVLAMMAASKEECSAEGGDWWIREGRIREGTHSENLGAYNFP